MNLFWGRNTWSSVIIWNELKRSWYVCIKSICIVQICTKWIPCNEPMNHGLANRPIDVDLHLMRLLFHLFFSLFVSFSFIFLSIWNMSLCVERGGVMSKVIIYNWRSKWFNDCSFMSRSMRYLTKRAYLTFTINMRFSLISTCCCQFGQIYHHHHHWLIAIVPAINLLQPSWAMTTNPILNSSEYNFRKFNLCMRKT